MWKELADVGDVMLALEWSKNIPSPGALYLRILHPLQDSLWKCGLKESLRCTQRFSFENAHHRAVYSGGEIENNLTVWGLVK